MLELRRRIDEVNPKVVVCEDAEHKEYAEKLLDGLGFKCEILSDKDSRCMLFFPIRAVWIGSHEPPRQKRYDFVFAYWGGLECS